MTIRRRFLGFLRRSRLLVPNPGVKLVSHRVEELISAIVTFFKRIGITADVGFKVSSHKVLQQLLRKYGVPNDLFERVCIIVYKIDKIPIEELKKELGFTGILEDAIEQLLQVLSVKSLDKLEVA